MAFAASIVRPATASGYEMDTAWAASTRHQGRPGALSREVPAHEPGWGCPASRSAPTTAACATSAAGQLARQRLLARRALGVRQEVHGLGGQVTRSVSER